MVITPKGLSESDLAEQLKNEENTKKNYITPIIEDRWRTLSDDKIIMEYYFTDGRISVDEYNTAHRGKPKKVDYLLLYYNNIPIALVEAKGENHDANEGYSQAKDYAMLLDVPFAYATNGIDLIEIDLISGVNKTMKMSDFPYPKDLWERFKLENGFTDDELSMYSEPYYVDATGRKPRYYQRNAINRIMKAMAKGQKRILLVMATGTGKTYTSFQFIYRLWKSKKNIKTLYLADRNILIDQTLKKDFKPFGNSAVKIDNKKIGLSYEIYLGLYQQLTHDEKDYYKQFPKDFFDLVVVDECHRGSASVDSNWHEILTYFNSAIQIGMTATPKDGGIEEAEAEFDEAKYQLVEAKMSGNEQEIRKAKNNVVKASDKLERAILESNVNYFGNPIYTYSLKQGIEDGFLAPYKVIAVNLDIDKYGYTPDPGTTDKDGNPVEIKTYEQKDFDRNIIVEERRELVAKRITEFLKVNDQRYGKTIVFCETIEHARAMVQLLENENADIVKDNPRYIVQITGDNEIGKKELDNFQDPGSKYPCIAVTSKLLGTGVDIETCKTVVLDRTIGSMTEFKQIIGRGTRIKESYEVDGEEESKMFFTILDFRKNFLKFNDPDFDGEPVDVTDISADSPIPKPPIKPFQPKVPVVPKTNQRIAHMNGIEVSIVDEQVEYLDADGNLVRINILNCIRNNVIDQYPTPEAFQQAWLLNKNKKAMGFSLLLETDNWENNYSKRYGYAVDTYDIIRTIAFDIDPPVSKEKRVNTAAMYRYINSLDEKKQELVPMLLKIYETKDFEALKDLNVFNLPQFTAKGWTKLSGAKAFGGKQKYYEFLSQLENKLYEGEV